MVEAILFYIIVGFWCALIIWGEHHPKAMRRLKKLMYGEE